MTEAYTPIPDEETPAERLPAGNFVSVTSMQLKDPTHRVVFLELVKNVLLQLKDTSGVLAQRIYTDQQNPQAYYTVTVWDDRASMQRFRDTGHHAEAMKLAPMLAGRVSAAQWTNERTTLPTLEEVKQHLQAGDGPDLSTSSR